MDRHLLERRNGRQTMDRLKIEEERKRERLKKVSLSPSSNCPAKLLNIPYIHVPWVKLWAGLAFWQQKHKSMIENTVVTGNFPNKRPQKEDKWKWKVVLSDDRHRSDAAGLRWRWLMQTRSDGVLVNVCWLPRFSCCPGENVTPWRGSWTGLLDYWL